VLTSAIFCIGLLATSGAHAQGNDAVVKLGEFQYMSSCAACHGADGKGDGPVAMALSKRPSDLTQLSKQHNGKFPADYVTQVIDGRKMINPHGDRKMPIWGYSYYMAEAEKAGKEPHDVDTEEMVLGRITALTRYIESIQAK
jgi:mono/diheme cytochrome c family protein